MPIFILSIIIQISLVIHIVKTGRNTTWVWIVVLLPLAGSIAYLIVEVLPELLNTRSGRQARRALEQKINPNKEVKAAIHQFKLSDSIENTLKLANELYQKQAYAEAKELYAKSLTGIYAHAPDIMHGLAKTEFALGNFATTKKLLDELIQHNPDFKNPDAHLLYARTLDALEDYAGANEEYEALHKYFAGPDADYYYAQMQQKQGNTIKAVELLNAIIDKAELQGSHYKSLHKDYLKKAKNNLKELEGR
ncbi:tetratricopeptide repeat protein [Thiofilum flexile]|uniref:tetratricopeptide repeat protein n=1 Tax=Thiofilum flexile TaxID=125627 RepID=UPI00036A9ACD|nr:tetratricopeptide repeat protein [Thiofilum flexile]